ncbi:hypothetical protein HYT26_04575 [Candidatus Pacearchaeota archaeon]|nr:hypothetical protein [Candidatus Pacearchaeota archaeon]
MAQNGKSIIKRIFASFVAVFSIVLVILLYLSNGVSSSGNSFITDDSAIGKNVEIYPDRIVINIENASIGRYAPTGSMLPTLNEKTTGIKVVPMSEDDIHKGDIVSFRKDGLLIIHRVAEKGTDKNGTYFITKGDNNLFNDGKIRFKDIEYKTIMLIY